MNEQNEKQAIEEMAHIVSNSIMTWANEMPPISNPHFVATNLYNAGYRKQSEGEWVFEARHFFDDYGDLIVYAIAHCSKCKSPYRDNHSVYQKRVEQPEHEGYSADWNIDVEYWKNVVLEKAKEQKLSHIFCPNCGAKMKGY